MTPRSAAVRSSAACVLLAGLVGGCSTVSDTFTSSRIDYRSAVASSNAPSLQVPPDLTQLSGDPRYQAPSGTVSANAMEAAAASAPSAVAAPDRKSVV